MYDVIIIGAGPAGISACLYIQRANFKTLVIYEGESNLRKARKVENYYGFANGIGGEDLYFNGIEQAQNIGVETKEEEVTNIKMFDKYFEIETIKQKYKAKTVILATGSKKNKPKIKGMDKLEGKGISYCAICDGFFFRNKNVALIGSGNYAISEANELINLVNNVTILTNGEPKPEFRADNVNLIDKKIKEIHGENRVENIEFEDNTKLEIQGVFVAQGVATSAEFAKKLGIITENENIVVNENMQTNLKGIYACGDCTGGLLQISKAVYEGSKAGIEVIKYLKSINK